jgi:hypothetical protein
MQSEQPGISMCPHGTNSQQTLLAEFVVIHPGRRAEPGSHLGIEGTPSPDFRRCPKVADAGHAGADKNVIHRRSGNFGKQLDIVRIIGTGNIGR